MKGRGRANDRLNEVLNAFLNQAARTAWIYRLELALVGVTAGAWAYERNTLGPVAAGVVVLAPWFALAAIAPVRRGLLRLLTSMRIRRRWARACEDSEVTGKRLPHGPVIKRVHHTAVGVVLDVRVAPCCTAQNIESHREQLATSLKTMDVRVVRERTKDRARITLVGKDPFDDPRPVPWINLNESTASFWDPVPVGIDEEGNPVTVDMFEHSLMVGGEPGAGKSVALALLVATAARDPHTSLWLMDGKRVEFAPWLPFAKVAAGPDGTEAVTMLRKVHEAMERRYVELTALGHKKLRRDSGLPLHVIVCDELAFYLHSPSKKVKEEITELLRDLVARGRAAGFIMIVATQKPDANTVPTALRDLISYRLALRCNTPQASDTILGQGWASKGFNASDIPGKQRGVGYLFAEGELPVRIRGYYLSDDDVDAVASRAMGVAAERELLPQVTL